MNNKIIYLSILGTSLGNTNLGYTGVNNNYPSIEMEYQEMNAYRSWEQIPYLLNKSIIPNELDPFVNFAENVISLNKDIDIEIQQVVNKIFWELI